MQKEILFKGKNYPLNLNFLVFSEWESHTGKNISEISELTVNAGAREMSMILSLIYFGICDAMDERGKAFDLSLKKFIREIDLRDIDSLVGLLDFSEGSEDVGEEKNKRQHKHKAIA